MLPEHLANSMASTLQHIELIQAKEARLASARTEALAQMLHRVGTDYRTGALTELQLAAAFRHIHQLDMPGRMKAWNSIVGIRWQRMIEIGRRLPNGPEGSWVGEWPITNGTFPISGTSVVYVLFDETNTPCYVGSTGHFRQRMNAHEKSGKTFVRWQAHPCRDREQAYQLEDRLLKQHLPHLNKKASR